MKTYIIRLLDHDNFGTAQEKISWSRSRRTLLVWPDKKNIIGTKIELSLLHRYSQHLGTTLGIAARDEDVVENAKELGIPVYNSAREASRKNWEPKARKINNIGRRKSSIYQIRKINERAGRPRMKPLGNVIFRFMIFMIGFLSFLLVAALFLPSAEIEINLPETIQKLSLPVWASPEISSPNLMGGIPARKIVHPITVEGTLPSTGNIAIPVDPARGTILLMNISENQVEVPRDTIVTTIGDKTEKYYIQENVSIQPDPNSPVEAKILAVNPGTQSNVNAGEIKAVEGQIGLLVMVENEGPTTGGTERYVKSPTESDYIKLKEQLFQDMEEKFRTELVSEVQPGEMFFDGTIQVEQIMEEVRSPEKGQPGDSITLTIKTQMNALVINEGDLLNAIILSLDANLPSGSVAISDPDVKVEESEIELERDKITFIVTASRIIQPSIKGANLSSLITGTQPGAAVELLRKKYSLISTPRIRIKPEIWPIMPLFPYQIKIITL